MAGLIPEALDDSPARLGGVVRCKGSTGSRLCAALIGLAALALGASAVVHSPGAGASGNAPVAEAPSTMSQKLSSKLSPKAKKALMVGGEQPVTGLFTMAPTVSRTDLERQIAALGGDVQSWDPSGPHRPWRST